MTEKQTTAGKILRMIENVSPDDVAGLEEIDARVFCFIHELGPMAYQEHRWSNNLRGLGVKFLFPDGTQGHECVYVKFSRSRDALKAIRPDGVWSFLTQSGDRGIYCNIVIDADVSFSCSSAATEELAELHAIIQAIAHERSQP